MKSNFLNVIINTKTQILSITLDLERTSNYIYEFYKFTLFFLHEHHQTFWPIMIFGRYYINLFRGRGSFRPSDLKTSVQPAHYPLINSRLFLHACILRFEIVCIELKVCEGVALLFITRSYKSSIKELYIWSFLYQQAKIHLFYKHVLLYIIFYQQVIQILLPTLKSYIP